MSSVIYHDWSSLVYVSSPVNNKEPILGPYRREEKIPKGTRKKDMNKEASPSQELLPYACDRPLLKSALIMKAMPILQGLNIIAISTMLLF